MSDSTYPLVSVSPNGDSGMPPSLETDKNRWPACSLGSLCAAEQERLYLRHQVGYWRSNFQRCKERERDLLAKVRAWEAKGREGEQGDQQRKELEAKVSELEAKVRKFEHQLRSPKTEKASRSEVLATTIGPTPKRKRGQQPGWPSPPKRKFDDVPVQEEIIALPMEQQRCGRCRQPFRPFPGSDDGDILEIEVRAYRRRYRRQRYERS